jgi:tellurite resistance protein TehA-like permease
MKAYTSAAFASLGNQAKTIIPTSSFARTLSIPPSAVGDIFAIIGLISAIFTWLICFWFFALTTVSILRGLRKFTFTLNWWAFIFPNAGMAIALLQIADQLGSKGMQGVGAGLTIVLCVMWICVAGAQARALWRRDVLAPWRDEGVDEVNRGTSKKEREERDEEM